MAAPRRRVHRRRADGLLRPLQRIVFVALVHRSQYVDANSKFGTTRSLSYIAGPSTAGLLVQALTAPVAIAADALSFVVSALALRGVRVREPEVERSESSARADLEGRFPLPRRAAGAASRRRVHEHDQLLQLLRLRDLRPLREPHARAERRRDRADPRRRSFGALAGALIAPRVGRRLGIGRAVVVGSVLFPAPMALFPLAHGSHWLSGAMLLAGEFLASVGVMIFDVNQNSLMLMLIPHEVRSRVVGVSRFFNYGTRPFGALLGGVLGSAIGLRPTLWVAVAGCLLGVLFLLASPMPQMREEDLA